MEKFVAFSLYGRNSYGACVSAVLPDGEQKEVYLATDVDPRIAELEKALQSIRDGADDEDGTSLSAAECRAIATRALMG